MRHFFIFLFLVCSFNACRHRSVIIDEEKPFKIIGKIDDVNVDTVFFEYRRCVKDYNRIKDTISVTNRTFTIEGIISPHTYAQLHINDKDVDFYLDPGEMQLYLKKDSLENFVLKGSKTQLDRESVEIQTKSLKDHLYKIKKQLSSNQDEQNKEFLINQRDSIANLLDKILINFINSHTASYYSLDAIYSLLDNEKQSADAIMNLFNGLCESVRTSCSGTEIYNYIINRRESIMTNVSSFEALDKDKTLVKLSDFKGKYILIDFWASWCVPCINGFPHLKELYSKYKDNGLVVIGISIDRKEDEQKWLNSIEKYNITEWIHILSCKNRGENNICNLYDITQDASIPYYILIDKSGNVIKQWRGFNDEVAKEQNDMFVNIFEAKK